MPLQSLSSVLSTKYQNTVGSYNISYTVAKEKDKPLNIVAHVKKADTRFGYISIEQNGKVNILLESGVSLADGKNIVTVVMDDAVSIIAESE